MRLRATTFVILMLVVLSACFGGEPDSPAEHTDWPFDSSPSPSFSPSPTPLLSQPTPETANGTNYDACFDGDCEVLVTRNVQIPMDSGLAPEVSLIDIQIGADRVTIYCESERLAPCFGSSGNFSDADDDFRFDTTVGLVIDVHRHASWQMVVTFSLA